MGEALGMDALRSARSIDAAIEGSGRDRFLQELYSNSAVLPIAIVLLELVQEGLAYFLKPAFYAMSLGAMAQAAYLTRGTGGAARRIGGNLVAPAVYAAYEVAVEGPAFFLAPHHIAFWSFALAIGMLQAMRATAGERIAGPLLVAEGTIRSLFVFVIYAVFAKEAAPATFSLREFLSDGGHLFIGGSIAFLGLAGGLAALAAHRYLALLREVSRRFRVYSEWFFGRALLEEAVADPDRLALRRCERALLFLDVRGFTGWSEQQPPEAVAAALNGLYADAEAAFARWSPIRFKFTADEVMAVYADPSVALDAAHALSRSVGARLAPLSLGAGIGLHWGAVVEGLMGGEATKHFDVIGDPVNTAKRIEGAAGPGEILLSSVFCAVAKVAPGPLRWIDAKGKSGRIAVHLAAGAPLTAIKPRNRAAAVT